MAVAAVKQLSLSAATGVTEGRLRFNLVNGWVAQKLLFEHGLRRKPVSLFWFRLIWPLVWQRRFLMPLVGPQGIYCFYSRPADPEPRRDDRRPPCLEIAAGDGTLVSLPGRGRGGRGRDRRPQLAGRELPARRPPAGRAQALRVHQPES